MRYLLSLCCCFLLLGADGDGPPLPTFKDDKGKASFEEGKELFDASDWKAAEKCFKASQKSAEKDSKKLLKSWIRACKGGSKLGDIEKSVSKEQWLKAWKSLSKVSHGYAATPLRPRLDELEARIEPEVFTVLATFEDPPPEPEKTAGNRPDTAELNTDEKLVKRGKRSIKWREHVGLGGTRLIGWLPLARFEGGTLPKHTTLSLWIYSPDKEFGKFTVFFDAGNGDPTANPLEILRSNCYFHHLTVNHVGWKEFRVDLKKGLSTNSDARREEMVRLSLLVIPPSKPKTIYIDDVRLEKRM